MGRRLNRLHPNRSADVTIRNLAFWASLPTILLLPVPAPSATWNVPADHGTIQGAIGAAAAGDSILVAPGTYAENLDVFRDLSILSTGGADSTTIIPGPPRWGVGHQISHRSLDIAPTRGIAIIAETTSQMTSVDLVTGDRTIFSADTVGMGPMFSTLWNADYDPVQDRAVSISIEGGVGTVWGVDLDSGDRTILSGTGVGNGPQLTQVREVAVHDSTGMIYVAAYAPQVSLFRVDPTTGDRAIVYDDTTGTGPDPDIYKLYGSLDIDPINDHIYVTSAAVTLQSVLRVDPLTGDRTIVSADTVGTGPEMPYLYDIVLDPEGGRALLAVDGPHLLEVDLATGDRSIVAGPWVSLIGRDRITGDLFVSGAYDVLRLPEGGNEVQIVSQVDDHHMVLLSGPGVVATLFRGFTVSGGPRGGVQADAEGTGPYVIDLCEIRDNMRTGTNETGGGVLAGKSTWILNSRIVDNDAVRGAGVYADSSLVEACVISGNQASYGGGIHSSNATVRRCRIFANYGFYGGGIYLLSGGVTTECWIYSNSASSGSGFYGGGGTSHVSNCDLSGNTFNGGAVYSGSLFTNCNFFQQNVYTSTGYFRFCNFTGAVDDSLHNFDADPLYVDPNGADDIFGTEDDDFHLQPGSPCSNRGTIEATLGPTDWDGLPRIVHCVPDVGAHETDGFYDCNANGVPDACDLQAPTSLDGNDTLVPDDCEGFYAYNTTQQTVHATITGAIDAALEDDEILAPAVAFGLEPSFDLGSLSVTVRSLEGIDQAAGGTIPLGNGSLLATSPDDSLVVGGAVSVLFAARTAFETGQAIVAGTGSMDLTVASIFEVRGAGGMDVRGTLSAFAASVSAPAGLSSSGGGLITGYGDFLANVTNGADAVWIADTQVVGDYVNDGTTTVQNGTLTVTGTFTNNGVLVGDVSGGTARADLPVLAGHGISILGDFHAGPSASISLEGSGVRLNLAGHFDVAINDPARFDFVDHEVRMIALEGQARTFERMSLDRGADPAGLDPSLPGSFPIGTLRLSDSGPTVVLVDAHDNDGQGQGSCEAVYVRDLIVPAGAVLITNGCPVYYETLTLEGGVDQPGNLVEIGSGAVAIGGAGVSLPRETLFRNPAPNPVLDRTALRFDLGRDSRVSIDVFDLAGRRVRTVVDGPLPRGTHTVSWDRRDGQGRTVASGVYFVRMQSVGYGATKKLVVRN